MNSYKILGLNPNASVAEVKKAFLTATHNYKKTGNYEKYEKIKLAYDNIMNPELEIAEVSDTEKLDPENGYIYNIDTMYEERTKDKYMKERAKSTAIAESIPKIFNNGMDRNIFNRLFEEEKQQYRE